MPTILRIDGYDFMIYVDDHGPAHVHAFLAGDEATVNLNCDGEGASLRNVYGMKLRSARRAVAIADEHRAVLCRVWKEIHGDF